MATTELIKVEEFTALIKSAPDALKKNKSSIMACNNTGQCLLNTIESEGMNDELDAKASEYLKKVSVTIKNMQARRSPITQIFDRIRSIFTSDEKEIDPKDGNTIPGKIAYERDKYATKKRQEEKRKQEEAIRIANIEKEKVSYRAALNELVYAHYNAYFAQKSTELEQLFNTLHLNSFDLKSKLIREFSLIYPIEHFHRFTKDKETFYLDPFTKGAIKSEFFNGKYEKLAEQYKLDMNDLRQSFIDRLASKQQELYEIEQLRRTNETEAKKVEQERITRENAERKAREEEQARKDAERKLREKAQEQSGQMQALFSASEATIIPQVVKAKITEKIEVLHPNGFLEIFQMWWLKEGNQLTIEELEKTLKKMVTYCEKIANKDGDKISSKYIRYIEKVKAK